MKRYLSMRSVLAGALELPGQVENVLREELPGVREKVKAIADEGKRVVQSLRSTLREYRKYLEEIPIEASLAETLRDQADLLERCVGELEAYLDISSNLARDFPFRENPSHLSSALEQLNQAWYDLGEDLRRLREGEVRLRELYQKR